MMVSGRAKVLRAFCVGVLLCAAMAMGGCKDSDSGEVRKEQPTVLLLPADINKDGTISPTGLQKIEAKAGESNLLVGFVRAPLSDAGLNQLAKFTNIRRVEAFGSRITPAGVEKLKRAIPEVEVVK